MLPKRRQKMESSPDFSPEGVSPEARPFTPPEAPSPAEAPAEPLPETRRFVFMRGTAPLRVAAIATISCLG